MHEKHIQLMEAWCGSGTYNDVYSYIHGYGLRADNSSSSNNPLQPQTAIERHTKMNGVLHKVAASDMKWPKWSRIPYSDEKWSSRRVTSCTSGKVSVIIAPMPKCVELGKSDEWSRNGNRPPY